MRAKLGRARPISETELSFLGTFHLRFRKAVQEAKEAADDVPSPPEPAEEESEAPEPEAAAPESEVLEEPEVEAVTPPEPVEEVPPPAASSRPKRAVKTDVGSSATNAAARERGRKSSEVKGANDSSSAEDDIPTDTLRDEADSTEEDDAPSPAKAKGPVDELSKTIGPKKLDEALSTNDHRTVLRELYREVTAIAEGVWSNEVTPAPMVWDQVTSSDWYERNFSRLGLQPLSVFYEVTTKVDKKVRAGAERKELQEFLKETNFAKTLLSLRDMFQANNI
jgi:hypothetical protein